MHGAVKPGAATHHGQGHILSTVLPTSVPDHWRKWLGTLLLQEIEEAQLYVVVHAASSSPEILDGENKNLQKQAYRFYSGLTIAVPFFAHGRMAYLSGAEREDGADVREFTTYDQAFYTLGSPRAVITPDRVKAAKRLGLAIEDFAAAGRMERLPRILSAFRAALRAHELDVRLHQFVRVIEGFVLPESSNKADDFADRVMRVVTGIDRSDVREMYSLRGAIEHLKGPLTMLDGTPHERHLTVILRTIQAETIARYFLRYFLDTRDLWDDFATPGMTRRFWRDIVATNRQWDGGLSLSEVGRHFAENLPDLPYDDEE